MKIIYLRDSDDIINQYISFCRVFNEQTSLHGRTLKAAKEIIRICRNRNLLKEYLSEREKEVEGIMLTLFNQEQIWNIERENIKRDAMAKTQAQMVQNMFRHNMPVEDIASISELPVEQVNSILKNVPMHH